MKFLLKEIKKEIKHGDKITLNDDDILSYGSNRICYLYESNTSKLIKTARYPEEWEKGHEQSFSEWYVSKNLSSKNIDCRISLCQRWVRTNKGPGLIVDRIVNDKGQSITLRKLLFKREITVEYALNLVEKIVCNLSLIGVPASDFNIDNFVQEGNHLDDKIVMVDGFSPKNLNLKTHLLLKNKILANLYTRRKWRLAKSRFTYCAQKVYAGNYRFAAAIPLHEISPGFSDGTL